MAGESRKAVFAAIAGNFTIAVVKFIAAALTGSSAMISEGIHSVVDMGNGGLLFFGMRKSEVPADEMHPFGHGKELYFWSLIVAISIFGIGGGMSVYEGIVHIAHPTAVEDATLAYVVLVLSALIEGWSFLVAFREFRKAKGPLSSLEAIRTGKDPSLFTVVFEDSAAMAGLAVAFAGVFASHYFHLPWLDGAASVVIGLILATVALWLAYESKGLLVGEGAEAPMIEDLQSIVRADPQVAEVGPILSMYNGPQDLLLNLEVEFRAGISADDVQAAVRRIEDAVTARYPEIKRIFIEVSSLTPGAEPK
ncbi:MAG TPA: cation diffusion facilitator family transporter [Coriobacteriia bacterium]